MPIMRPIFDGRGMPGARGKAGREVANTWTNGAEVALAGVQQLDNAKLQLFPSTIAYRWLGKCTAATSIGANRWKYEGEAIAIAGTAPILLAAGDQFGRFVDALNIRELRNDATAIDGSPLPAGATIGPVGSTWSGGSWSTTELAGYVELCAGYLDDGSLLVWFSENNPGRCAA